MSLPSLRFFVAALLMCCDLLPASVAPTRAAAAETGGGDQGKERPASKQLPLAHLVYGPSQVEGGKRLPLVLYLHGGGERGSDLADLRRHGPPLLMAQGQLPRKPTDFYLVAPQCPPGCRGWMPEDLLPFVDGLLAAYPIDPDRITVTGQSMGGIGTIALLAQAPKRFAGGLALCGRGDESVAARLLDMPLWLVHGALDEVIPVAGSRQLAAWIQQRGGKRLRYDELPRAGHMIHNETYAEAAKWDWLLAQKRSP